MSLFKTMHNIKLFALYMTANIYGYNIKIVSICNCYKQFCWYINSDDDTDKNHNEVKKDVCKVFSVCDFLFSPFISHTPSGFVFCFLSCLHSDYMRLLFIYLIYFKEILKNRSERHGTWCFIHGLAQLSDDPLDALIQLPVFPQCWRYFALWLTSASATSTLSE